MPFHLDTANIDKKTSQPIHIHSANEVCPTCDQLIPAGRVEEVLGRLSARDAEKESTIRTVLQKQFDIDKAYADAKAKATIDEVRQQAVAQIDAAREDERKKADAAAADKIAKSESARQALQDSLSEKTEALASAQTAAAVRETQIHAEAATAQKIAVDEAVAAQQTARKEAEAALTTHIMDEQTKRILAEQSSEALKQQLTTLTAAKDAEIAQIKNANAAEIIRVKTDATETAKAAFAQQLTEKDSQLIAANAKAAEAEGTVKLQAAEHALSMKTELDAMRETMEKDKDAAISAEKSKAFEENQKLLKKANELQRELDKKTNDELGEGAEIDLYEVLKAEFPGDDIKRVKKGQPGADIIHTVIQNGQSCGKIVYDSKNHKTYRSEHAKKLREDQIAEQAEHAILSLLKFPQGQRHLHIDNGVVLANPARVTMIATMIRQHMIYAHSLRMSAAERESKTGALYDYITSERFLHQLVQVDKHAAEMLDLQTKEMTQHQAMWKKEGELLRKIQKAQAAISNDVGAIIGTAGEVDDDSEQDVGGVFG